MKLETRHHRAHAADIARRWLLEGMCLVWDLDKTSRLWNRDCVGGLTWAFRKSPHHSPSRLWRTS